MTRARRCVAALLTCLAASLATAGAASAQGELLYGADGAQGNPSNLYVLDPATGATVQTVGPIGFAVTGLARDPVTGTLYGSTSRSTSLGATNPGSLITINKATGAGTLVGDMRPDTEAAADITFTPDGTLYGWIEPGSDDLVTIDKTTGAATTVGNAGIGTSGAGLASSAAGTLFFAGDGNGGDLRTIDRSTGAPTTVATMNGTGGDEVAALAFNAAGTLFGVGLDTDPTPATSELITIDPASGSVTVLGPSVNRLDAIEFEPPPPPTPPAPPSDDYYEESCFGITIDGVNLQGGGGKDKLTGTPRADQLRGGGGKDKIKGLEDDDCLFGQAAGDKVRGNAGDDVIRGGAGNDKMSGAGGKDDIRAQDGDDKVTGGSGNDRIKAQGRGRDKINCGSGKDKAIVDVKDKVSKNCEKVKVVNPN